ncbi:DNA-directed RNA polymerase subunit delta [Vagococcus coleopterorum]|uniref:Probable DNA-directed RNA polymerase subunit delta n=1 Tax=Vagococcus coleopterorum TaxID=2714946 RepID=A0A6G8AMT3_9ENTE|nr:DNA-directed RNA polymerase subunit delta [Vagococcus coleopterorum]QIL46306.1 DNA-directed RNA polymerase subunit delta [Vagococcus coleopterorum]
MEIKAFKGVNKEELSMIEVAHAILEQNKQEVMDFSDLVNKIQNFLGKADSTIREDLAQFYTDLNLDGSFISLGENRWGLRSWYPIDSIDEEVSHIDEDEDTPRRKKRKKVNAFLDMNDEDAIDYNDDDPEDADLSAEDEYEEEEEEEEISEYNKDLSEIGADATDDDDELSGKLEDELTVVDEDDIDFDDDEDEE